MICQITVIQLAQANELIFKNLDSRLKVLLCPPIGRASD